MNNLYVLFCLFALTGCTTQEVYLYEVNFKNVCPYPVHIIADHHMMFPKDDGIENGIEPALNQKLKTDDSVKVLLLEAKVSSVEYFENELFLYNLKIIANGNTLNLDWRQFMDVLKKAKKIKHGNVITLSIKDPSLCPGN